MSSSTDIREPAADANAAVPSLASSPALSAAIGLVQGLLLWWLWTTGRHAPADEKPLLWALGALLATGTTAWWLLDRGFGGRLRRVLTGIAVGLLNGLLVHSQFRALAGEADPLAFDRTLAIALADFMIVALAAGFDGSRRRFDYDRLFDISWRNGLLLGVAVGMSILLWVVLITGGELLKMVGVPQLQNALREASTITVLSSTAFGLAMGVSLKRSGALTVLRGFCLAMLRWFLPLALALSVAWCIALPFAGLSGLLESHRTGFTMMWFCALAIAFANAAWLERSGPAWLVRFEAVAFPLLIVIAGVADYALWLRTDDVGLTEDRLWGWVAAVTITLHVVGYGSSILARRPGWMQHMPATNIAVSIGLVVALLLLTSPWGDVSRLAVSQQVARLQSGRVSPEAFDWAWLASRSGPAGREALRQLAATPPSGDARIASIGAKARESLASRQPTPEARSDVDADVRWWRDNVAVWPAGQHVDEALLRVLVQAHTPRSGRSCMVSATECALWVVDLDKDGTPEVIWLQPGRPPGTRLSLYAQRTTGWQLQASPKASRRTLPEWQDAIASGRLTWLPPRYPDLVVDGERLMFNDEVFARPASPAASR